MVNVVLLNERPELALGGPEVGKVVYHLVGHVCSQPACHKYIIVGLGHHIAEGEASEEVENCAGRDEGEGESEWVLGVGVVVAVDEEVEGYHEGSVRHPSLLTVEDEPVKEVFGEAPRKRAHNHCEDRGQKVMWVSNEEISSDEEEAEALPEGPNREYLEQETVKESDRSPGVDQGLRLF